jgi:protein-S-isoprenylcysteine O-methyltransferase Ste14
MYHSLAGVLLIAQATLIWFLDKTVHNTFIDVLAILVWLMAILFLFLSMPVLRRKGEVPPGKRYTETTTVAHDGLYGLIRHPQYFGWALMYVAVFLFNPRWPVAALGLVGIVCVYIFTVQEERKLLERFGEPYAHYMQAVPRFNILLGILRGYPGRTQ